MSPASASASFTIPYHTIPCWSWTIPIEQSWSDSHGVEHKCRLFHAHTQARSQPCAAGAPPVLAGCSAVRLSTHRLFRLSTHRLLRLSRRRQGHVDLWGHIVPEKSAVAVGLLLLLLLLLFPGLAGQALPASLCTGIFEVIGSVAGWQRHSLVCRVDGPSVSLCSSCQQLHL